MQFGSWLMLVKLWCM